MENPMKLADVMDEDLAGFKLAEAYFLELSHGLMGFFPAIFKKDKEMMVCLDKSLLKKVWSRLPRKKAKVVEAIVLVSMEGSFGFDVRNENKENVKPVHILLEQEFNQLIKKNKDTSPFEWAPGLLGLKEEESVRSPFE